MAISSRRQRRPGIDIWPGFVDALSQLLMVIVFILLVFTAGQFYLTDALSGRDAALQKLTQQVNQLAELLSMARSSNADLQNQFMQLTQQLEAANQRRAESDQDLATARAHGGELQAQLDEAQAQAAQAQTNVDTLAQQVAALREQLAEIAAALDAAETKNQQQQAQLADLGQRLNQALLSKVQELARYRSEFFGRLRE